MPTTSPSTTAVTGVLSSSSGMTAEIWRLFGFTASILKVALPMPMEAVHLGGMAIGSGPPGQRCGSTLTRSAQAPNTQPVFTTSDLPRSLSGIGMVSVPPGAFATFVAMAGRFCSTKSRPGRETRTEAAFSMALSFGKPPGSGVVPPHPPQPEEQPPPLHEATRRKKITPNTWRKRENMNPPASPVSDPRAQSLESVAVISR